MTTALAKIAGEHARTIRMPLQVGTAALWNLVRWSVFGMPAIALGLLALFGPLALFGWLGAFDEELLGAVWGLLWFVVTAIVVVPAFIVIAWAFDHRDLWFRRRPSDVVLDERGLHVEGGVHDGTTRTWSELRAKRPTLREHEDEIATTLHAMLTYVPRAVAKRFGREILAARSIVRWELGTDDTVLASTDQPDERESLQALLASIDGVLDPPPASPPVLPADVLGCEGCGSALAPADAETLACGSCHRATVVPPDLRDRIRAALAVPRTRARVERRIALLLDQPGARWTERLLRLARVPMRLAWYVAIGVLVALAVKDAFGVRSATTSVAFAVALVLVPPVLLRRRLADRRALRVLTLGFGARPPRGPDAPWGCHRCGGPLPLRDDAMLRRCVYCKADNVIGLDLRREAARLSTTDASFESALRSRRRERTGWGIAALVAAAAMGASTWMMRDVFHVDTQLGRTERACDDADARACVRLGNAHTTNYAFDPEGFIAKEPDEAAARSAFERACDLHDGEGCHRAGSMTLDGRGGPKDYERAVALHARGCDLGHPGGCRSFANLCKSSKRTPCR